MKKLNFIFAGIKYNQAFLLLLALSLSISSLAQITGADQPEKYLPLLKNKRIALVVNQTSICGKKHLVDFLLEKKIKIKAIFAPEHGFRGDHAAGEKVKSSVDKKTGITVFSLYGSSKKPLPDQLKNIDAVVFDIQDVGARFYTYISSLHYVMEACAEQNIPLIILDRPNPNGHYVDGPVLDTSFRSFVGMHPVPIVHGCTVGEYARMINGEGWLKNQVTCSLTVIKVSKYNHMTSYSLPVKPSPNLPTMSSIYLYPSVCLFEGTSYSLGRGTDKPFERIGKPGCTIGTDTFTPVSIPGVAEHPPLEGKKCTGILLTEYGNNIAPYENKMNIDWLIGLYKQDADKEKFFTPFFDQLAGSDALRKLIQQGKSEQEIRKSWEPGLNAYLKMREKYLLYGYRLK